MAPQQQDVQTAAPPSTVSTATKNALSSKPVAVKNALNEQVEHFPFEHPELRSVYPTTKYDPIPILPYEDRGLKADPTFKNLLQDATVTHLAPKIGTELSGIQLHELTDAQRDELALLVSHRGVVFFRDQEIDVDQQLDLGRYYGPLHVHQNLGHPEGHPEVLVVENSVQDSARILKRQQFDPDNVWHSDVSNERQPPSYTSFKVLTNPPLGGDTLWASAYEAYERLTPAFKTFIQGLTAIHSSKVSSFPPRQVLSTIHLHHKLVLGSLGPSRTSRATQPHDSPRASGVRAPSGAYSPRHWPQGPVREPCVHDAHPAALVSRVRYVLVWS
jgi:sulfonate dioxygenase